MRTIKQLIRKDRKVYIYLRNEAVRLRFSHDADTEGITFDDGEKPQRDPWTMLWHSCPVVRFVFLVLPAECVMAAVPKTPFVSITKSI